jgi:hypothetical protein
MMSDARLERMIRAVTRKDEKVEFYDPKEPQTVVATIRGVFSRAFAQFDSDQTFGSQFDHTMEAVMFVCRTADAALVKNDMIAHYTGATPKTIYRVMDRRHDGHGMTALVLHK